MADQDAPVLTAVTDSLLALISPDKGGSALNQTLDILTGHIDFIGNCIASTASDARHRAGGVQAILSPTAPTGQYILPLLTIPRALEPFLTIYLHGVMNGAVTVREQGAGAIYELVNMCEATALKPYLIKTTGPLIRVIGER